MRPGDDGLELYVGMMTAMNNVRDAVWDAVQRKTEQQKRADQLWELADDMLDELRCCATNAACPTEQALAAYAERLDELGGDEG